MKVDQKTGLLIGATYSPSPHFNERPQNTTIDTIVVHGISLPPRQFGGDFIEKFFCGRLDFSLHPYFDQIKNLRVSAHLFINRQGHVTQFVPFHERAWHAGESMFKGRTGCNDFSIGIELEGADDVPYEKAQYVQLTRVVHALMQAYPGIVRDHIVGHSDIAPGRKTDPGEAFDWSGFSCLLEEYLA